MEPHKRRDNPPRRGGSDDESEEPQEPQYEEEQPQVDPSQYQQYEEPGPGVYDDSAQQQYVDPNQQYADPNQQYADPNQQYVDPAQQYADPSYQAPPPSEPEPLEPTPPPYVRPPQITHSPQQQTPGPRPQPVRRGAPSRRHRPSTRPASSSRSRRPVRTQSVDTGGAFMTVMLALVAIAMVGAIFMIMRPADLSAVGGFPAQELTTETPRNLLTEAQAIMFKNDQNVTFSEKEVNDYLNQRIRGKQGGALGAMVKFDGVYADFGDDTIEIYLRRTIFGVPITMSNKLKVERFRSEVRWKVAGGSIGKIRFQTKQLQPILQSFVRVMVTVKDEVEVVRNMGNIRFEENQVTLMSSL